MEKYPIQKLDPKWVHEPITPDIVEWCKSFGKFLAEGQDKIGKNGRSMKDPKPMTTSQLRRFFGEVKHIEMQAEVNLSDVAMLNPLLAYAVGRDVNNTAIKQFQEEMSKAISEIRHKDSYREYFKNFVNIFEAVVAYHKLYGGK
ncbi:MAG: type III-A CRISPR-associated protein Csm2 [Bacteroidales bacterium]|nr:type III-A CRISPR-associated protein Csm2 [Bacteroidales bacterium]